jgi:membrane protease YdiL (CAAX protease family)
VSADEARFSLSGVELGIVVGLVWVFELVGGLVHAAMGGGTAITPMALAVGGLLGGVWTLAAVGGVLAWRLRAVLRPLCVSEPYPSPSSMAMALGVGLLGAGCALVLNELFATGESPMAQMASSLEGLLAISVVAMALPIVEEVYYRGVIFGALRRYVPAWSAIGVVTVWFAGVHAWQVAGDWVALPVIALMGLLWTVLRHRTGSLWPGIASHLVYNATLIAFAWVSRCAETVGG